MVRPYPAGFFFFPSPRSAFSRAGPDDGGPFRFFFLILLISEDDTFRPPEVAVADSLPDARVDPPVPRLRTGRRADSAVDSFDTATLPFPSLTLDQVSKSRLRYREGLNTLLFPMTPPFTKLKKYVFFMSPL